MHILSRKLDTATKQRMKQKTNLLELLETIWEALLPRDRVIGRDFKTVNQINMLVHKGYHAKSQK